MRKPILTALIVLPLLLSSCWQRIGDLTSISNRNIDSSKDYVLIHRNAEAIGKMRKGDALERAIDKAVEEHLGEYMMNVKVYVRANGSKVKVQGDVYGLPENIPPDPPEQ